MPVRSAIFLDLNSALFSYMYSYFFLFGLEYHKIPIISPPPPLEIGPPNLRRKNPSDNKPSQIYAHGLLVLAVLLSIPTHFEMQNAFQ